MQSITLIQRHLRQSLERVLLRIEDMRPHALVAPTPRGGSHTLWVLGHLAFIEQQIVHSFMLGEVHPRPERETVFDGASVSDRAEDFPPFDEVLADCRAVRARTLAFVATLEESDLDRPAARIPKGHEDTFGTYRACLQFIGDHTYMHRGQLADARRAAGIERMWV